MTDRKFFGKEDTKVPYYNRQVPKPEAALKEKLVFHHSVIKARVESLQTLGKVPDKLLSLEATLSAAILFVDQHETVACTPSPLETPPPDPSPPLKGGE